MKKIIAVTRKSVLSLFLFSSMISCGGESGSKQSTPVTAPRGWKVVSSQGVAQFVYVEPENARDRYLMAQILQVVVGQKSHITMPVQVMFFDKENETPLAFPMTDSQMLHQVAQYNYNPNNGFEEFRWFTVTDSNASPPERATKRDNISPGIAP